MKRAHRSKECPHTGPYRIVQARALDAEGEIVVLCQGCGGFQGPWSHENRGRLWGGGSMLPTDPWRGTEPDLKAYPENVALLIRSKPLLDHGVAHALAMKLDRMRATLRGNGQWFMQHGEIPPWWESKRHEDSGDLMVRDRLGWTPPAPVPDPEDVYA